MRAVVLLTDKNHNVLLTGVTLVTAVVDIAPVYAEKFTRLVPALVKILRKLLMVRTMPAFFFVLYTANGYHIPPTD